MEPAEGGVAVGVQLETYAFRTVLRAIGHVEPLRQRVLDAHSAKLRQVRERASE